MKQLCLLLLLCTPCIALAQVSLTPIYSSTPDPKQQISEYIPRVFEDTKGNLWLGTNGDGLARYDGKTLTYFGIKDGLGGKVVRAIAEDKNGNIWLGTEGGLTRFDGKSFTNFTVKNGLPHNEVWSILIAKGTIWVGTLQGACRSNTSTGTLAFTPFHIPAAIARDYSVGVTSPAVIFCIIQDKAGNIWFATNGRGVFRYNGKALTNFSAKDGLCNDFVQWMLQDNNGDMWFATRHGGISRYNGKVFTNFSGQDGLCSNEVWYIFADNSGNIWFTGSGCGVTKYDGKAFTNFRENNGITRNHVQGIAQDSKGTLWFGFSGGLFRLNGTSFINVTKNGPWR